MRKLLLLCIAVLGLMTHVKAQSSQQPKRPTIWHMPDSVVVCPAFRDTIWAMSDYTMVIVYQSLRPDTAQQLWKIRRKDSTYYAISTHGFTTKHTKSVVAPPPTIAHPCIYTMQQCISPDTSYHDAVILHIGADTIPDSSRVQLYEAAYFNSRLTHKQRLMYQTSCALKYGITLDTAHYISTTGDTLWNAVSDKNYYHRVQGIGTDTTYHLYITESNALEDSILYIYRPDTLPLNKYVLLGDDNEGLGWSAFNGDSVLLLRTWQLRSTDSLAFVHLILNRDNIASSPDTVKMVIINDAGNITRVIRPDSINLDNQYYYTIPQVPKHLLFSFLSCPTAPNNRRQIRELTHLLPDEETDNITKANPYVEQTPVIIVVYDPTGKMIDRQIVSDINAYHFQGATPCRGLYMITIYDSHTGKLLNTKEWFIQ